MRSREAVFWLTLVDFLLQVIFFGLLCAAVLAAADAAKARSAQQADRERAQAEQELVTHFGVSNLVELTDKLTRLAPASEIENAVKTVQAAGGSDAVAQLASENVRLTDQVEDLEARLGNALGKPPCLYEDTGTRVRAISIAKLTAYDDHIEVSDPAPEFLGLLKKLQLSYKDIQRLPLDDFQRLFAPVLKLNPECRYYVDLRERTVLLRPRKAIEANFLFRAIE